MGIFLNNWFLGPTVFLSLSHNNSHNESQCESFPVVGKPVMMQLCMCIQAALNLIPVITSWVFYTGSTPGPPMEHSWQHSKRYSKAWSDLYKATNTKFKKGEKENPPPLCFCPCLCCKPAVMQANLSLIDVCAEQAHQAAILWREGEQFEAQWDSLMQRGCKSFQGDILLPLSKQSATQYTNDSPSVIVACFYAQGLSWLLKNYGHYTFIFGRSKFELAISSERA